MENTELDSHPQRREPLWKSRFTEDPALRESNKIYEFGHWSGQLVKTGEGDSYFKCEDNNAKLKGISKIKETLKDHSIFQLPNPKT